MKNYQKVSHKSSAKKRVESSDQYNDRQGRYYNLLKDKSQVITPLEKQMERFKSTIKK